MFLISTLISIVEIMFFLIIRALPFALGIGILWAIIRFIIKKLTDNNDAVKTDNKGAAKKNTKVLPYSKLKETLLDISLEEKVKRIQQETDKCERELLVNGKKISSRKYFKDAAVFLLCGIGFGLLLRSIDGALMGFLIGFGVFAIIALVHIWIAIDTKQTENKLSEYKEQLQKVEKELMEKQMKEMW